MRKKIDFFTRAEWGQAFVIIEPKGWPQEFVIRCHFGNDYSGSFGSLFMGHFWGRFLGQLFGAASWGQIPGATSWGSILGRFLGQLTGAASGGSFLGRFLGVTSWGRFKSTWGPIGVLRLVFI